MPNKAITPEEYAKRCRALSLVPLGTYTSAYTPLKHLCIKCLTVFIRKPRITQMGCGCPDGKCAGLGQYYRPNKMTPKQYDVLCAKAGIRCIGNFVHTGFRVEHECLTCKHRWIKVPLSTVRTQSGCPQCNPKGRLNLKKEVRLNGKLFVVQGYEPWALRKLVKQGTSVDDIYVGTNVPVIDYTIAGKSHKHYPDIFVAPENRIIEVKGLYTLGVEQNTEMSRNFWRRIKRKCQAALDQGYDYQVWVFDDNGETLPLPHDWYKRTRREIQREMFNA